MESSRKKAAWRQRIRENRRRHRIDMARRLADIPPETTLLAAFDLIEFAAEWNRVAK